MSHDPEVVPLDAAPRRQAGTLEQLVERAMFASRWLLAPMYLGLALSLLLITAKFFQEMAHAAAELSHLSVSAMILQVLEFVDLALVGGLIVMVMFSGFESFVSRLDVHDGTDQPEWLGKLDAGSLKQKVAASIIAISSISLLRTFMNLPEVPLDRVPWYVALHLTLVVSGLGVVAMDRFGRH
jgi:uncharacterized protein (TIGR00645 family)